MEAKLFEVRDRGTLIPVLAVRLVPSSMAEEYLIARAGYGTTRDVQGRYVLVAKLNEGITQITYDPYAWNGSRTMTAAHRYIVEHFDELKSGDVVDVEYILGESSCPKQPERTNLAVLEE